MIPSPRQQERVNPVLQPEMKAVITLSFPRRREVGGNDAGERAAGLADGTRRPYKQIQLHPH